MLRQMAGMGVSVSTMARRLGVSSRAVRSRMQLLGLNNQASMALTSSGRTYVGRARFTLPRFGGRRLS
ncbi:HTH domain-containing protein [Komagataeibacter oboediens]|uniref:HTH domain-containing protein n=2 Tax=Komagataeibacter oboediens TaxID=65958 RepID=A0ABS5SR28_9PROT|nr:HTH domain-containing protein [Komagataeibacter oboediens]MBT0676664.1 HTH domain-containing protein [Komagataeibacter oboediens]MBT0678189.1 HTH domain-containing protein [Komagataeibacter oboediens]